MPWWLGEGRVKTTENKVGRGWGDITTEEKI